MNNRFLHIFYAGKDESGKRQATDGMHSRGREGF